MKIYCAKIEEGGNLSNKLFGMLCIAETEEDQNKIEILKNITLAKGADVEVNPEEGTVCFRMIKQ